MKYGVGVAQELVWRSSGAGASRYVLLPWCTIITFADALSADKPMAHLADNLHSCILHFAFAVENG